MESMRYTTKYNYTRKKQCYEISTMNKRSYFTLKPIMFKPIKNARNKECFETSIHMKENCLKVKGLKK
jgi:hypothetical protein